ncbi:DegT/DnrJ/EryC1/StrS aminotransferase family protein [bacterium]|nr:DegT/DnrJ/EryC1/StrS aminotransferase family protein [bacterium]
MIFQSLGSNYTFNDVLQALFGLGSKSDNKKLAKLLAERYGGEVRLFYKGREAMAVGLGALPVKGKKVAILGFTCYAVYQAVESAGAEAVYIDLPSDSLNFTVDELQKACKKHKDIAAVIVQNTLGVPAPITKIAEFCRKHDVVLVEDLAHSIGARYSSGEEAGTVGDLVCLSFSRDKVIDAVSGGALVVRNEKLRAKVGDVAVRRLSKALGWRDRIYPLLATLVRQNYMIGLGKIFHAIFIRLGFMQKATDSSAANPAQQLPAWNARAALNCYSDLETNLNHRRLIATIYADNLPVRLLVGDVEAAVTRGTNLRFPIAVTDRDGLVADLKKFGIHVSDTWYDSPVAPPRHLSKTNYQTGDCPNAERLCDTIINLPTHIGVSKMMAKLICERIERWQSK